MRRVSRWEPPVALICALACLVPLARMPAAFALLCLLPGVAICRHRLGETSLPRALILGSLMSLCVLPALAIPAALVAGRPDPVVAAALACAVTALVCLRPAPPRPLAAFSGSARAQMAALGAIALLMQIGLSVAQYPAAGSIRWRGLPDLMFFNGIYTQIAQHTPPLDPENGAALLVHNWIYHFHFALLQMLSGLTVPAMQRVVSAWMALVLLGLVYLIGHDMLKRPSAGMFACLLLMTSGEIYWLARCAARLSLDLQSMPWAHSPFGITLLFGWYNLPPLAAALAAWYFMERSRAGGRGADLALSIVMCAALAFFHPVFYGVFMTGFCLWLAWLALKRRARPAWLLYLATPLPFFLLYKLPYYGGAMPPSVVHPVGAISQVMRHAGEIALSGGIFLALGGLGLIVAGAAAGPAGWIAGVALALRLFVRAPNPHWFNDMLYIALAIAAGAGWCWLASRWRRTGAALGAGLLAVAGVSFALHARDVLGVGHDFTPGETAAGAWLARNTAADDLVAILPNSQSSFTVLGIAGRRVVHGWTGHLLDFHAYAKRQEQEVREIFTTGDPARAADLARRYRVSWLLLGPAEREVFNPAGATAECFPSVFAAEGVEVRGFTCGAAGSAPARAADP